MADNKAQYGLRPYQVRGGGPPKAIRKAVASGYDGQDDNNASIVFRPGDPVSLLATGYVDHCQTTDHIFGVVQSVLPYWNAADGAMTPAFALPNQVVWGTVEERRSWLMVVPIEDCFWEIDVDDSTSATTYAEYLAFIGENATMVLPGDTTATTALPKLDISTHNVDRTLVLRIEGISSTAENADFSGANVKLIVSGNVTHRPGAPSNATIIVGI